MLIDAKTNVVEPQEKERVIGIVLCSKVKTSRRDRIFSDYQRCVDAPNADLAHCYNTYLRGRRLNSADELVENPSVVEAPVNGEHTGRVIDD